MSLAEDFQRFCKERIRSVCDGYLELANEKVTIKEIYKAYNRWIVTSGGKKYDFRKIFALSDEVFGDSRGTRVYYHIRVFMEEEDLEEFEKEHEALTKEKLEQISKTFVDLTKRVLDLEKENLDLKKEVLKKEDKIQELESFLKTLHQSIKHFSS